MYPIPRCSRAVPSPCLAFVKSFPPTGGANHSTSITSPSWDAEVIRRATSCSPLRNRTMGPYGTPMDRGRAATVVELGKLGGGGPDN